MQIPFFALNLKQTLTFELWSHNGLNHFQHFLFFLTLKSKDRLLLAVYVRKHNHFYINDALKTAAF